MRLVALDIADGPSPSGSDEVVLADQGSLRMIYMSELQRVAVATFHGYAQMTFGYPNDEISDEYFGPVPYGFYEVADSDWAQRLTEINRRRFPDSRFRRRHFVVICHETLLQVLAHDVTVTAAEGRFDDVATEAMAACLREAAVSTVLPHPDESPLHGDEL